MDPNIQLLFAGASGILTHLFIFIRGEWHMQGFAILRVYSLIFVALVSWEAKTAFCTITEASLQSLLLCVVHLACLFFSITTYRVFFHRLGKFPGPPLARVSKLWHVANTFDSHNYLLLENLRKEYGEIVRTGL
jgi:hypothetical protein